MRTSKVLALATIMLSVVPSGASTVHVEPCEALSAVTSAEATVTLARIVESGPFSPSAPADDAAAPRAQSVNVPVSFCRFTATLKPSSDSDIKIEVWMPAAGWNGKLQAVGNGAFNGSLN